MAPLLLNAQVVLGVLDVQFMGNKINFYLEFDLACIRNRSINFYKKTNVAIEGHLFFLKVLKVAIADQQSRFY